MFLMKWFWSTLQSLGLVEKRAKLVLLALDNAGKTTLLHMLRDNRMHQHVPTHHPTTETLTMMWEATRLCVVCGKTITHTQMPLFTL